jgi:hypothetical protein
MIKIQYQHLKNVADFLQNTISAKGKKNVHRMRIVKAIADKNKEVGEEEVTLLKEYAHLDDEGELKRTKEGNIDFKDVKGFNEAHKALFEEYFMLDDKNLESALKTVEKLVNDYDKELIGKPAEAHFILVEAFEESKEEDNE